MKKIKMNKKLSFFFFSLSRLKQKKYEENSSYFYYKYLILFNYKINWWNDFIKTIEIILKSYMILLI